MRILLIKDYKNRRKGERMTVSLDSAKELFRKGVAIKDAMMQGSDYSVTKG